MCLGSIRSTLNKKGRKATRDEKIFDAENVKRRRERRTEGMSTIICYSSSKRKSLLRFPRHKKFKRSKSG